MSIPVVLLDPGHGGRDPGAVYNGLREKELNLNLALKVASRLNGVKVLLTRERDVYLSLADRVAISRRAEPDLFLSLHANAGGGRGFESFIYSGLEAKDPAVAMQKAVHARVMKTLGRWDIVDRGTKRAAFYVLKHNVNPSVLIESLFLDNAREAAIWREPLFVEALATAMAEGIYRALGLDGGMVGVRDPVGPQPKVETCRDIEVNTGSQTSQPLPGAGAHDRAKPEIIAEIGPGGSRVQKSFYTVQVGAFTYLENARQRLAEAQAAGFKDAYIYQKIV